MTSKFTPNKKDNSKLKNTDKSAINETRVIDSKIIQSSIENILKQKVFLESTTEVHKLGKDMMKLRKLLHLATSLNEEIKTGKLLDSRYMKSTSSGKAPLAIDGIGMFESSKTSNHPDYSKLPTWLISASKDISRLTVEQQFQEAASLIIEVRSYVSSVKGVFDTSAGSPVGKISLDVDEKANHLARILRKSLNHLPPSNLWGYEEKKRRMKILIALGHELLAAEGFAINQGDIIQKLYRIVEASGDNLEYISKLTKKFFHHIIDSSKIFLELFHDHRNNPTIISYLLDWSTSQISSFIDMISRQIILGVNEQTALAVFELRASTTATVVNNNLPKRGLNTRTSFYISKSTRNFNMDDILPSSTIPEPSSSSSSSGTVAVLAKPIINDGPLTLASQCLDIIFCEVEPIDALGLQGFSIVEYLLLPEVSKFIVTLGEEIIKELTAQVHQDTWYGVKPYAVSLSYPGNSYNAFDGEIDIIGVGSSYQLLIASLNFFLSELVGLLRLENQADTSSSSSSTANYSRADVCEAESASTTCLLRIVLIFIMELEDIELTILNSKQIKTFQLTLRVTESCLLPSLREVIDYYGFSMSGSGTSQSYQSAGDILLILTQRIDQLLNSIDTFVDEHH